MKIETDVGYPLMHLNYKKRLRKQQTSAGQQAKNFKLLVNILSPS